MLHLCNTHRNPYFKGLQPKILWKTKPFWKIHLVARIRARSSVLTASNMTSFLRWIRLFVLAKTLEFMRTPVALTPTKRDRSLSICLYTYLSAINLSTYLPTHLPTLGLYCKIMRFFMCTLPLYAFLEACLCLFKRTILFQKHKPNLFTADYDYVGDRCMNWVTY